VGGKMIFSPEYINELRVKADLLSVVSKDTEMKRVGNIWKGRCPFPSRHEGADSDPSFVVYPAGQRANFPNFYCFGCHIGNKKESGYGSDIFEYLRARDSIAFDEAVRSVGESLGIPPVETEEDKERNKMYELVLSQNRQYYKALQENKHGLEYLTIRGIQPSSILKWRLGYVPLDSCLPSIAGRLAIPISDSSGRAVGFGFRSLDGSEPKYLNSPASAIFKKSDLWFGLHHAKQSIIEKGEVIIVEGYFDVMLLHQHGVTNAIASMGTAVNNLDILKKYTNTAIVWTDGDLPGRCAAAKYTGELMDAGFFVKIVDTNGLNYDPADVALNMKDDLALYLEENTVIAAQYQLNGIVTKLRSKITEARLQVIPSVIQVLKNVKNQQELDLYVRWIAPEIGMEVDSILAHLIDPE
jgi:DNA primase